MKAQGIKICPAFLVAAQFYNDPYRLLPIEKTLCPSNEETDTLTGMGNSYVNNQANYARIIGSVIQVGSKKR